MSLGLVSPILNRGVRSRWVSTLPAGSKMLTIDAAGDVSYTDIPTAAWGSITGTLSNQTDLQNALNAKLSLTGGTLTGIGSAGTSTLRVNAGSGSSFTQINDNGTVVIDSDTATGTFPLTLKYAGTTVASVSYQGTITGGIGAFSSLSLDSGFVILDTDATNVLAQRSSTAAQAYRIYNTFTNVSNYERGQLAWESNEFRIGSAAAGTGTQRNTVLGSWNSGGTFTPGVTVASTGVVTIGVGGANPLTLSGVTGQAPKITLGTAGQGYIEHSSGTLNLGYSYADQVSVGGTQTTIRNQLNNTQGTITASTPMTLTQTWNNAAVTFNTLSINATDTASASGSTLADLRIGNQEKFKVIAKGGSSVTRLELWSSYLGTPGLNWYAEVGHNSGYGGFVSCPGGYMESVNIDPGRFQYISSVASVNYRQWQMSVSGNVIKLSQGTTLEWYGADYRADTNTSDLVIRRDAAQTLAQRNGANAQTFRIYNTFTDASNYRRLSISSGAEGGPLGTFRVHTIATQAAGTGTGDQIISFDTAQVRINSSPVTSGVSPKLALIFGGDCTWTISNEMISFSDQTVLNFGFSRYGVGGLIGDNISRAMALDYGPRTSFGRSLHLGNGVCTPSLSNSPCVASSPISGAIRATGGSGTNIAGASLFLTAGQGTGTGAGGAVKIYTAPAGSSGTSLNALVERFGIEGNGLVTLGGTTSSFPAIKRNAAAINFRLADDSADCDITAAQISGVGGTLATGLYTSGRLTFAGTHAQLVSGGSALQFALSTGSGIVFAESSLYPVASFGGSFADNAIDIGLRPAIAGGSRFRDAYFAGTVNASKLYAYNTYTDASNYERGKIEWSSNVLRIGTEKAGTGSARALELQTDGTTRLTIGTTGDVTIATPVTLAIPSGTGNALKMQTTDNSTNVVIALQDSSSNQLRACAFNFLNSAGTAQGQIAFWNSSTAANQYMNFNVAATEILRLTNATATLSVDLTLSTKNIVTDTTTGTKIGTATTQKIGFYNATPVVQPASVADATDAASVITQLNLLLSRMRDLGIIAT